MKVLSIAITAIYLVVLTSIGIAQDRKFEFMAGGGIESPISPSQFNDLFELGFTGKFAAGYFISPQFTVGANLSYNRFGLDRSGLFKEIGVLEDPNITVSGGELSVFEFAGVAKYYILPGSRMTNFYILGGPGVAVSRSAEITVKTPEETMTSNSESETDFMLTGGVGLRQKLGSNLGLFVEGRYSYLFTTGDNISYLPLRIGITF